jgi:Holliday junction resolvase RusA-like endonuclease
MALRTADFVLPVPLQPKARPRFGRGGAYTDSKYRAWMQNVRAILSEWWTAPPLKKGQVVSLHLKFFGPGTSDLDNLEGAVMDAGNGIVWVDDRVIVLQHISAKWEPRPKNQQSIYLKVIWNEDQLPAAGNAGL